MRRELYVQLPRHLPAFPAKAYSVRPFPFHPPPISTRLRENRLAAHQRFARAGVQDSKPYIISAKAHAVIPDPAGRNQDFTIAANTVFASLDDMKFYDDDCEAHKAIKAFLKPRIQGVMTVYHEAN